MGSDHTFDVLIAGSGFGGSLTAMILQKSGLNVCLVEKGEHPRFAIGESSTPIADMILRDLAKTYRLPFLHKLSRYGTWQKHHPNLVCGLKRGFSYYAHQPGTAFTSDRNHSAELLVAASVDDENSDTNWYRRDVDQFLVQQAVQIGVLYYDRSEIRMVQRNGIGRTWDVEIQQESRSERLQCNWIIDATGGSRFSGQFFGTHSTSDRFSANSMAVYTHLEGVRNWKDDLAQQNFHMSDYPYNPDNSALHQIIREGWIWMLRFNNDVVSTGLLIDLNDSTAAVTTSDPRHIWNQILSRYPSLTLLFQAAKSVPEPGKWIKSPRLQRTLNRAYGDGWVALPHTAGFVDPMHSTGIAHTLCGVEKICRILTTVQSKDQRMRYLEKYDEEVFKELALIDKMVSASYDSRSHFRIFSASVMLYFTAAVQYEQLRLQGVVPDTFLCASDPYLERIVHQTAGEVRKAKIGGFLEKEADAIVSGIRKRIEPVNAAGLMDPKKKNMYHHTAVLLDP